MARLVPSDKGTHFILCAVLAALVLVTGGGPLYAAAAVLLVAVGREVYGWRKRGKRMTFADATESALDFAAGVAGGAVVLASALVRL